MPSACCTDAIVVPLDPTRSRSEPDEPPAASAAPAPPVMASDRRIATLLPRNRRRRARAAARRRSRERRSERRHGIGEAISACDEDNEQPPISFLCLRGELTGSRGKKSRYATLRLRFAPGPWTAFGPVGPPLPAAQGCRDSADAHTFANLAAECPGRSRTHAVT